MGGTSGQRLSAPPTRKTLATCIVRRKVYLPGNVPVMCLRRPSIGAAWSAGVGPVQPGDNTTTHCQ